MTIYADLVDADRRLQILALLAESPGYSASADLLHRVLGAMGHDVSRDRLAVDLAWLAEQGLLTRESVGSVAIARLSARGGDVAAGRTQVPGVARPGPR